MTLAKTLKLVYNKRNINRGEKQMWKRKEIKEKDSSGSLLF